MTRRRAPTQAPTEAAAASGTDGSTALDASIGHLTAIVAVGARRVIGRGDGTLPWHAPTDLAHFRSVTTGHALVVGHRTARILPRLDDRHLVVVTGDPQVHLVRNPGSTSASDPAAALAAARRHDPHPVLIGGAATYAALWHHVTDLWWTDVDTPVEARDGDVHLPERCTLEPFTETSRHVLAPAVTARRFHRADRRGRPGDGPGLASAE